MVTAPIEYNAHSVETEVQALWRARRLPPAGGMLGPSTGPAVRQFEGSWTQGDFPSLVAHRALAADIDARYLSLVGRRAVGTLRRGSGPGRPGPSAIPALLTALGIWVGGDGGGPWDPEDRSAGVQTIVGRLASKGVLVTRDEAFRLCPSCGAPRSPERILYNEQEGDTFLVRFPVRVGDSTANALVWVDAAWKLLGTSALLVNPQLRYVVAEYRRRDEHELILTSQSSLARLRAWIPDAQIEVVEEKAGRELQGLPYSYPLRHEFPMGGDLAAPSGTILAANDVGDSGTGVVPLVPGHGPTDARIAAQAGVTGWPLVTPKGKLDFTLMHKYAGLDLDTTNEFIERDLAEAGALLARLRVKRGVPHCTLCGTPLLWVPGRAWCLEASRLPPERRATFTRLLPRESLPGQMEVAPWPVSEATSTEDAGAVALLECTHCDRLSAPDGPTTCPCGGQRTLVRRHLLPSSGAAFSGWARFDPFPDGDSVHLYVGHRRRVPSVVNHLAALCGVDGAVGEVSLTVLQTVAETDVAELVEAHGADAVRAAIVRSGPLDAGGGRVGDRCRQEARRIRRWWTLSREVLALCDPAMLATFARPIGEFYGELEVEDRAILARWERTRVLALSHYDQGAPGLVHRRAFRFLENDLVEYRALVQPRLGLSGTPTTKRAALRTLAHLMRGLAEVLAPLLPFTSEAVHRAFSDERTSLFERPLSGLDRSLLNDDLYAAWDRWRAVVRSLDRFRGSLGIPRSTVLPSVALVLPADDAAARFRQEKEVLARLARVQRLEIGSPKEPWAGRQRAVRPIESEIQKAYGSQASQIIHLLARMPARRWEAALGQEELSVVINGLPRRVFPSMVTLSDSLPERVVPVPWPLGEMYAEVPAGVDLGRTAAPPLSPDAFWLVRRLEGRLRPAVNGGAPRPRVAIVTTKDPLASELRAAAEPLARFLDLTELRVVTASEGAVPPNAICGRTRTGDRWSVHVPDLPARARRRKQRAPGARLPRVSVAVSESPTLTKEVDYADDAYIAHEEEVRVLGHELDDLIGLPLLGPAKVAAAWDHGIHSVEDLRQTPFETVAAFPGFGGPVAALVVSRLGGSVPPAAPRHARQPGATRKIRSTELEVVPAPIAPEERPVIALSPRRSPPAIPSEVLRPVPAPPPEALTPPPTPIPEPPKVEPEPVLPPPPVGEVANQTPSAEVSAPLTSSIPNAAESTAPPVPEVAPPDTTISGDENADVVPRHEPISEPVLPAAEEPAEEPPVREAESVLPEEPTVPTESLPAPESEPPLPPDAVPRPDVEYSPPLPEEEPPSSTGEPTPPAESTPAPEDSSPQAPLLETPLPGPAGDAGPHGESTEDGGHGEPSEAVPTPPPPAAAPEPEEAPAPETLPVPPTEPVAGERLPVGEDESLAEEEAPPPPSEDSGDGTPPPESLIESGETELPAEAPPPSTLPESEAAAPATTLEDGPTEPGVVETIPPPETRPPESGPPEPSVEIAPEVAVGPEPLSPEPPAGPSPPQEVSPPLLVRPVVPPSVPEPEIPPLLAPAPEPAPPVPPSGVELTVGDSIVAALNGFLESTAAGHHGVCVVRESPERIRARVGSRPIEVIWLTNIGRGPALRPSDLDGVWSFLCRKLFEERVTAFFLEGIEYLVRLHGADAVLTGLVEFDRLARENDARVWVFLAPALMKPADIDRFRGTFGGGPAAS
jgi:hypothetical protein